MKTDLHLVGQEYSWVGSIFYFVFLLGEWPFGPVMQRLPLAKLLSSTILAWGALTVLMGATNNAAGIMTLRFLMGFFEAPLYPMMSIMTVMWYKKSEQPLRVTVWFTSLSSVITGIVSFGIGHTHTAIASWRLLFIVLGGFTLLWGIVLFIFLPDSPTSFKFLDEREKFIAVDRMKDNMTGIHNPELKCHLVAVSKYRRTHEELTVNAMVFTSYCVANIIAPQLFLSSEAPHYPTGYNGILGCEIGAIVCRGLYALGCYLENNRRDRLGPVVVEAEIEDMLDDRTDKEKPSFRYVY
ncbi:hypothetical protein K4K56_010500 [Colletotrichum sp. SAR 10_98]|nr:hypothetical protein K4K56_010500 [Colletotrichum sp. SAR 10_98]